MAKQDLIAGFVDEYGEYNRLYMLGDTRTDTGDVTFGSVSSGTTYDTLTWNDGEYADTGENGMLLILQTVLTDYLLKATDFNSKADKSYTDAQLGIKADLSYVDAQLTLKAPYTYVDTSVATKVAKYNGSGVIPISGWGANTGNYSYKINVAVTGMTTSDNVDVMLAINSVDTALDCGLAPTCDTYNGGITFYAREIPLNTITFNYLRLR